MPNREIISLLKKHSKQTDRPVSEDIKRKTDPARDKQQARKFWRKLISGLIISQLFIMNLTIFFLGFKLLSLSDVVVSIFITGVFAEIAGFVVIALKYDFSD